MIVKMMCLNFFTLLIPLVSAIYRDNTKTLRTLPAFTNSLVNLGKLDFAFYFMAKPEDFRRYENSVHSSGIFGPRTETLIEESCPCSSKYSRNFPKNNPSELLKKILTGNDLFSFNKEPETSYLCCGSHENVREETVMFEFNPKQIAAKEFPIQQKNQLPFLPFILENAMSNKLNNPIKPKAVEIFFFPKKKDMVMEHDKNKKKEISKDAIQIVGDKEIRNDFKTMKLPSQPAQSSVKKDLGLQEKTNAHTTKAEGTTSNPNML